MKKYAAAALVVLALAGCSAQQAAPAAPQPLMGQQSATQTPEPSTSASTDPTTAPGDESTYLEMVGVNWNAEETATLEDARALELGYEACANREDGTSVPADRMFPDLSLWNENVIETNAWLQLCPST